VTVKPNWGKSFVSGSPSAQNQLVRVQLPHSRDFTLYLQPMRNTNGTPAAVVNYHVTVGTGGIALVSSFVPVPLVGVARHYVADTLEVSVITPGGAPTTPRIVAANAALGRPSEVFEPGGRVGTSATLGVPIASMPGLLTNRPDENSWTRVDPGTNQIIRIPPFATHLEIRTRANNGAAASEMQVYGVGATGGFTINNTLVGDYAVPRPLDPEDCLIAIVNTNINPLIHFDVLCTFTCSL
jgi:hypothetical protein